MKTATLARSVLLIVIGVLATKATSSAQVLYNLTIPNNSFEDTTSAYFQDNPYGQGTGNGYSNQYPAYDTYPTTEMFNGWLDNANGGTTYAEISTSGYSEANGLYAVEGTSGGNDVLTSLNPITTVANGGTGGIGQIANNATYTLTFDIYVPSGANPTVSLLATTQGADPYDGYTYQSYPGGQIITGPSPYPLITSQGTLATSGTISPTGAGTFENVSIQFDTLNGDNSQYLEDGLSIQTNFGSTGGVAVDDFVLTELVAPEPGTWALLLAGLAGLFIAGRRKLEA